MRPYLTRRRHLVRLGFGLAALPFVAGCGGESPGTQAGGGGRSADMDAVRVVPLRLRETAAGGPVVLAPLYFEDEGPFLFSLSTGVPQTVIAPALADRLGLAPIVAGRLDTERTVAAAPALVRVDRWRLGSVVLAPAVIAAAALLEPETEAGAWGLLGTDVLSRFEQFTVDYAQGQLLLLPVGGGAAGTRGAGS